MTHYRQAGHRPSPISANGALIYVNQLNRHYAFGDPGMAPEP